MPTRPPVASGGLILAVAVLGVVFALVPASAQQIHRHTFAGKNTALVRWDANVRVEEKEHDITTLSFKSQPSSEHIKLVAEAGIGESAFVHYYYDTPPAPVSEVLSASVWVKATKPGIQLRARVVFPKERDPARPESLLTMLVVGKTYEKTRAWDKLTIEEVPALLGKHLPAVQAKIGRTVNTADAYIDRLVLNLYAGPGPVDVWVDDLDIGPVKPTAADGSPLRPETKGETTSRPGGVSPAKRGASRLVEQRGGQLLVDGKPYFFRAIRHTGTPLHVLRAAGFDTLWMPPDATPDLIQEAGREGWLVIPSAPRGDFTTVGAAPGPGSFDAFRQRFDKSDVLFWDLGGGLTDEQRDRVYQTYAAVRRWDRKRPVGGDLWDGFGAYSTYLDVVGAHRWPLFTSLEMTKYKDWLSQRRNLTGGQPVFWTWVQNHLPDWYAANLASRPQPVSPGGLKSEPDFTDPVGPHPEQVRQLAYISLASGCRGLGFWSDRYLADSHQGRDRLQGMALLNTELDLISPVLMSAGATGFRAQWLPTNDPNVQAALISGQKGLLLLPIWMGPGDQYVPPQAAVTSLKVVVPTVPEGYAPWLITPAGAERLYKVSRGPTGTELTIDEFDMVAPVVFTDDQTPTGIVVWWQDHARRYARLSALWALDLAAEEYEKVRVTHLKLVQQGVQIRGADRLFEETRRFYTEAQTHFAAELYDRAYRDATRALRPLRVIMRDHWKLATEGLDLPTASPFAVSFFTLPQHWDLDREVKTCQPSGSLLPYGNFELSGSIPAEGIPIDRLPGWSARTGSLASDQVVVAAGLVRSGKLADDRKPRQYKTPPKTMFSPSRPITQPDEGYTPPSAELGQGVLKLEVRAKAITGRDGKPVPRDPTQERTFLAVDSPAVRLPPGTLVRVSGWVKIPQEIGGTADGVLFYDDAGGEPLAVRVSNTIDTTEPPAARLVYPLEPADPKDPKKGVKGPKPVWKQFHLYRRVPATGQIGVTVALTGLGVAYFDDIRIEPMVAGAREAGDTSTAGKAAPGVTTAGGWNRGKVTPASWYPRR